MAMLKKGKKASARLEDARVPKKFEPIFAEAQRLVRKYFGNYREEASKGAVEISGERYVLVRAASMSVDFFQTVKELYRNVGEDEALTVARSLLFDIAHAIGKVDARKFHKKLRLKSPIEKLSAGPIHFAHTGWAFVDILAESKPSQDENCFLVYEHPYSFESDAWLKAHRKSDFPVCVMNAGYSSGWCEESFDVPLVAMEITCKARGDKECLFVMAHPAKIEKRIKDYVKTKPQLAKRVEKYEIPGFFKRKLIEETLRESEGRYRKLFEESNDAVFIHFADGKILDVNDRACAMLGYPRETLLKMTIPALHSEECVEASRRALREVNTAGHVRFDSLFNHRNGTTIDVDISASLIDREKDIVQEIVRDITERKRAERELIQKERKIRFIAESSVDMIFLLNKSGTFLYVSPSSKEILGYEPDEMVGTEMVDYAPEGEVHTYWTKLGDVFMHKKLGTFESTVIARDGRHVPVEINGRIAQHNGQFVAQGTLRDISERKRSEEARYVKEQEFRLIFENTKDAIFWADPETGLIINCNRAAEKLLEHDRNEIIGMHQTALHPPDNDGRYARIFQDHLKNKGAVDVEAEVITKAGERIPVDITASVTPVGGGEIIQGIFRDISERKEAERALKASEAKYRTIFETSPEAIVLLDTNGYVLEVNERVSDVLGFRPDEIRGKHLLEMPTLTEDAKKKGVEAMRRRLQGEDVPPYELDFITKDGERRIGLIRARELRDEQGEIIADLVMIADITEQKRVEDELKRARDELEERVLERTEELRESQKLYSTFAETAEDYIFIINRDLTIQYVNAYGMRALGMDGHRVWGQPVNQLFPAETGARFAAGLKRVMETGEPLQTEDISEFPSGSVWLNTKLVPLKDDEGKTYAVVGLSRDMTERKKAEEALQESEHFLASIFDSIQDGISILDPEYRIVRVNSTMEKMYAHAMPLIGKHCYEAYHGRTKPCAVCPTRETLASGRAVYEVVPLTGVDGNVKGWLDLYSFPRIDEETGEIVGIIEYVRDITKIKEAEEALKESEERYRTLFEDSPISLWEEDFSGVKSIIENVGAQGVSDFRKYFDDNPEVVERCSRAVKVVDINKATLELYGFLSKEELREGLEKVFTEQSFIAFREGLIALAEGRLSYEGEAQNKTISGEIIDIEMKWSVAPGYEDDCSRVLVSIMDITGRKRLENEVRQALRVKSEFMSTMSHELRTPLSHIISCTDLVMKDDALNLPESRMKNLNDVLDSSDSLLDMINNILEMARVEAGRIPMAANRFSLAKIIERCVDAHRPMTRGKDLALAVEVDKGLPEMHTDQDKLVHILNNLIGNAIKFSDHGEVRVSARLDPDKAGHVEIGVRDTGIGIPEEKRRLIFEQFRQVDSSSTRKHAGMGLGLAIVQAYVTLLGGTVEVVSEVDKGSTFTVFIPIQLSTPAARD